MLINVGSSGSSDVTLPYSPRADPVEERQASGVSGSPSPTGIEIGPERVTERISVVDAVMDGINRAKKMQHDILQYSRPVAVSETMFWPHILAPQSW